MNNNPNMYYALLIGINEYASPKITDLGGCVNDVDAMEQLLRDRFKVPQENIVKLTDDQATHKAIKKAFREHLIKRAQTWSGEEPPAFLFHYSGHGSQAPDETGAEPDGLDETLVPHDGRTYDDNNEYIPDIKDWELGQMLDQLTAHVKNVTVFLDCCHSGSGTRDIELDTGTVITRDCEADEYPQPEWSQRPATVMATRGTSPSGWRLSEDYVLLAACRDRQKAKEFKVKEGNEFRQHGAMTHFLVDELSKLPPGQPLTYRELQERISDKIKSNHVPDQEPQCEGQRDRPIFGGIPVVRDIFLNINRKDGKLVLDAGLAHGLREGTELEVHPPETKKIEEAGEPLAVIKLTKVGAVRSEYTVTDGDSNIPDNARAVIALGVMQRPVRLNISDEDLSAGIEERFGEDDVKPYVNLVGPGQSFDFQIILNKDDKFEIQGETGKLLVLPFAKDDLEGLGNDLAHLARYNNTLNLRNTATNSTMADAIGLKVRVFKDGEVDGEGNPVLEDLKPAADGKLVLETGREFVLEIENKYRKALYFAVFECGYAWDIVQWYPAQGSHQQIQPEGTFRIGYLPDERMHFSLDEQIRQVTEHFKVIATLDDAEFEILQQAELKSPFNPDRGGTRGVRAVDSPLNRLMKLAMTDGTSGKVTRGALTQSGGNSGNEWTTTQVEIIVAQPSQGQEILGGRSTELFGFDIKLEPPKGFSGKAQVLTVGQSSRDADGDTTDLNPPAGLVEFGELFMPLEIGSTRDVGPAGAVIEIEAEDESRNRVTKENPLKMDLQRQLVGADETVIALAYDGSFYYPVGRPDEKEPHILNVEWLPEPAPEDEEALHTRSLGRVVKLYLYKTVLKWEEASLGLHKARFVPEAELTPDNRPQSGELAFTVRGGEVRYRDIEHDDIKSGQRVALFVHGFSSETRWMVAGPAQFLKQNGFEYDHILTFDYETYANPIKDTGKDLSNALKQAGFSADDGVHLDVFAHSMGTQVCRSMIEQHDGADFVDRYFMAGPPNSGSRLTEVKRLLTWAGILLLNQAGPTPPAMIASWALKKFSDDGHGGADLAPSSKFFEEINSQNKPAKVAYYVLAGYNEITSQAEKNVMKRIMHKLGEGVDTVTDFIFSDQNDLIISVRSMKSLTGDNLFEAEVPCNHFGYFDNKESQQQLLEWLRAA